jgi:metal-responsive CopG/Arc/MetJ family transcriptional regulator
VSGIRGAKPRAGTPAGNVLKVRLTDTELAQLDAYVAKHGRDRSHWVRKALQKLGALKGVKA